MVAPRTSKTITAWWLPSNLKQVPLVMKCQIKENSQIFPNTNLDPLVKNFGYLQQLRSFTFLHCTISIYDPQFMVVAVSCPKVFFRKWCWCRDLASNGSDNKGSLANHNFWRLAKQAKPSLYGSWRRTGSILEQPLCCPDLDSNGPKNQHSLEEQFWHLATAAS